MNILFVDQFSEPGGAQLALLDVIEGIEQRGWTCRVMAPGFGSLLTSCRQRGIPVDSLPLRPLTSGRKSAGDLLRFIPDLARMRSILRRTIERDRVDVVYINGPRALPAAVGLEIPVLFHAHSYVNGLGPRWLTTQAVRWTKTRVIAASQFVARQFQSFAREPIRVIHNGAADYATGSPRMFASQKLRIGMPGRIAPEKGQLDFVRAARLIGNSASFTIYGASLFSDVAYERKVREEAETVPVILQDWRDDVRSIYRELDILVVPSFDREASTRVIMEAFSAGVPVVAYASGGIPEIVTHGRTGLLTESPGHEALAASLRQLMADRNQMKHLSLEGRAEWKRRFTRSGFQNSICEVIESLRDSASTPASTPSFASLDD